MTALLLQTKVPFSRNPAWKVIVDLVIWTVVDPLPEMILVGAVKLTLNESEAEGVPVTNVSGRTFVIDKIS